MAAVQPPIIPNEYVQSPLVEKLDKLAEAI